MKGQGKAVKKKVIAIVLAVVVAGGAIGGYIHHKNASAAAMMESADAIETVSVEKMDIENTTMVTGVISSAQTASESAKTTDAHPVATVNVKVGDEVKKGELLYTLDMSSVEDDLKTQQQTASAQSAQDSESISSANRQVSEAQSQADSANQAAVTEYNNAVEDQTTAQNNLNTAQNTLSDAKLAESNALSAYNEAKSNRQTTTTDANGNTVTEGYTDTEIAELKEAYDDAVSKRQSAETAVSDAQTALTTASRAVETAAQNVSSTAASGASSVASSQDAVDSASLSASTSNLSTNQAIAKDKEELTKGNVYASMDGTVTAVNVEVGQTYSGTDGVVINNTGDLVASANVDEGVISNIKVGMKVHITTEASGDKELDGVVTFIAPTATKNTTSTDSNSSTTATSSVSTERATYRVDVTINDSDSNILLGMTAKMNFVLDSAENALVVPTADLTTDESGNAAVIKMEDDGSYNTITVKTGVANDYYTQITSKEISEGDQIQVISTDSTTDEDALLGVG
jgi:HlyD family secretion protein